MTFKITYQTKGGDIVHSNIVAENEQEARYKAWDELSWGSSADLHQIISVEEIFSEDY